MHEGAITTQIVETVLKEAEQRKAKKVTEVLLAIGSLMFLNPEQVLFWYEMLTKGTIMQGSKLIIEENKGTVHCSKCGYKGNFKYVDDSAFHVPMPTLQCPKCGGAVEIVNGKDCLIKSIKMLI
ncbi:MAG: hydrogenase maturation nickel metallochaperone HypA [Candidatus Bathyarchaeia archaeon]